MQSARAGGTTYFLSGMAMRDSASQKELATPRYVGPDHGGVRGLRRAEGQLAGNEGEPGPLWPESHNQCQHRDGVPAHFESKARLGPPREPGPDRGEAGKGLPELLASGASELHPEAAGVHPCQRGVDVLLHGAPDD